MDKFVTTAELTLLLARVANDDALTLDDLQLIDDATQTIASGQACSS